MNPQAKQFWLGVSTGILFLFAAANILILLFIVPKFEQIFADALPGKPLPALTNFIIEGRLFLIAAVSCWLVLCVFLIKKQKPYAIVWINIGTFLSVLQIVSTIIAFSMPMIGGTTGMSDAANH